MVKVLIPVGDVMMADVSKSLDIWEAVVYVVCVMRRDTSITVVRIGTGDGMGDGKGKGDEENKCQGLKKEEKTECNLVVKEPCLALALPLGPCWRSEFSRSIDGPS